MPRCAPSLRPAAFPPPSPPPMSLGFVRGFTGTMQPSDSSPVPRQLRLLDFLSWPGIACATAGQARSPKFRRVPFARNGVFDHGRASAPRINGAAHVAFDVCDRLGPCDLKLSRLNNPLHAIVVYASSWSSPSTTQHSLPGGSYPLPGPDFHRLEHASLLGAPHIFFGREGPPDVETWADLNRAFPLIPAFARFRGDERIAISLPPRQGTMCASRSASRGEGDNQRHASIFRY